MMSMFQHQAMHFWPLWPFLWFLAPLALLDLGLKGWGMWRAARMGKQIWFIALLIVNSLGILPIIFLLLTKSEYAKIGGKYRM